jgi:hypothetical protein
VAEETVSSKVWAGLGAGRTLETGWEGLTYGKARRTR